MKFFRWGKWFSDEDYSFEAWIAFGRVIFSLSRHCGLSRSIVYSFEVEVSYSDDRPGF